MGRPLGSGAVLAVTAVVTLTACSAGTDAVAQGGNFEFV